MQKQVTLGAGQSQRVPFLVAPAKVGTYDIRLSNMVGSFDAVIYAMDWTPGVEVQGVTVSPPTAYVGEEVDIEVSIQYPEPLPADIQGVVTVNGTKLTGAWTINSRNLTLIFKHTPTAIGTFTVMAQDKSATLTVIQHVTGTYYNPFGGPRVPLCTDIIVPNVAPFAVSFTDYVHPGGNLVFSSLPQYGDATSKFWLPHGGFDEVKARLPYAYPIVWSPDGSVVTDWVAYYDADYSTSLLIMAIQYTCGKNYWDSREELAMMIAGKTSDIHLPNEWILQYGVTCPVCNGTGRHTDPRTGRLTNRNCSNCAGLGKIFEIDLVRGVRDWVKPIEFGTNPPIYAGIAQYNYTIKCPYCSTLVELDHEEGKLALATLLLGHIETAHPTHPLTSPR